MRRFRLLVYFGLALSAFAYAGGSHAWAHMGCAVQLSVHPHATVFLSGRPIAHCASGAAGCKCVSCWAPGYGAYSACYPLVAPIPH